MCVCGLVIVRKSVFLSPVCLPEKMKTPISLHLFFLLFSLRPPLAVNMQTRVHFYPVSLYRAYLPTTLIHDDL